MAKQKIFIKMALYLGIWFVSFECFAQTNYYFSGEEKRYLTLRTDKILIKSMPNITVSDFASETRFEEVTQLASRHLLATVDSRRTNLEEIRRSDRANRKISDATYMLQYANSKSVKFFTHFLKF